MSYEKIRKEVMDLDQSDQRRLIMELVPEVWHIACPDQSCAHKIKDLVDQDIWRPYDVMHMDGI